MEFTTENGEKLIGELVHFYSAFEGGMRYIFESNGIEYRCVMNDEGEFIEYIP